MFGAAGALVTFASATPSGTMFAQAMLSTIAPAPTATPRGSTGLDASGFGEMVDAMLAEVEGSAGLATSSTEPNTASVMEAVQAEVDDVDTAAPGTSTLTPLPLTVPMTPDSQPGSTASPTKAANGDQQTLPSEVGGQPTTPLPPGPTIKGKVPEPQVLPGETPDVEAPPATGPGTTDTAVTVEAVGRAEAVKSAVPSAVPATVQPAPPQLRALAERTSKPVEASETRPADADAASGVPLAAARATETAAAQPVKPAGPIVAVKAEPAPVQATPESAPAGDHASASAEAPSAAREHTLSTLSRATIDATAQIAAQIQRKLEGRSTRFEIALRPDELGRVDVKLDIDSEGRLAARLAFDNPAAATDLRGRADELRRQLEDAGFHLADDAFEFAERDSGSNAFDRGQDARDGQNRAFSAAARLNAETDAAQPPRWMGLTLSPSGVDMKV